MYAQSLRLGRILGIPLGVNYSWFIIFLLITLSLTTQYTHLHPTWSYPEHLVFGILTSLLFFGSVLLHELGHSVLALKYNIPVRSITLFIFGGVAQITKEPEKPVQEFNIAVAGPVVSAILSLFFYGVMLIAQDSWEGIAGLGEWLGRMNLSLAVFNLLPGFPLDGGRILRSIIWKYTGSFEGSTKIAAGAGHVFAYGFIVVGVWQALTGNFFGGLWIGFIGWFLLSASQSTTAQLKFRSALRGVTAMDVMTRECLQLPGSTSVADLVEHHLLKSGTRCAMVMEGDRFRGLVTLHEIKQVPKDDWATTSLQAVMVPERELAHVSPDTPVETVLQKMNEHDISQIPVIDQGRLLGIIGRDGLLALVQTHLELKA
ncbi:MAG: site-2 protease family protein [Bacteroidota bacterium]